MSRILLVEDNADLAFGLRNNLEIEGHEVDVEADGARGLARVRQSAPDLLILDIMLPGLDGFRVLRGVRDAGLEIPVLILTARGEESDVVRGLKSGADDYLTKPFGLLELLARVQALLRRAPRGGRKDGGEESARDDTIRFGAIEVRRGARTVTRGGQPIELAPKELELLLALWRRRGSVVSRVDLLREVWGYAEDSVTRTVDTHIGELRRKLEDEPSAPRHILTARKAGYRLEP